MAERKGIEEEERKGRDKKVRKRRRKGKRGVAKDLHILQKPSEG